MKHCFDFKNDCCSETGVFFNSLCAVVWANYSACCTDLPQRLIYVCYSESVLTTAFAHYKLLICAHYHFTDGCDYQADVCWETSNTIKQTSAGKFQISSRRLLAKLKYY